MTDDRCAPLVRRAANLIDEVLSDAYKSETGQADWRVRARKWLNEADSYLSPLYRSDD